MFKNYTRGLAAAMLIGACTASFAGGTLSVVETDRSVVSSPIDGATSSTLTIDKARSRDLDISTQTEFTFATVADGASGSISAYGASLAETATGGSISLAAPYANPIDVFTNIQTFGTDFTLSAHSQLVVSVNFDSQLWFNSAHNDGYEFDAGARLAGYLYDNTGAPITMDANVVEDSVSATFGVNQEHTGTLSLTFVNATDFDATGFYQDILWANSQGLISTIPPVTAPVPEPASAALLLSGLGLLTVCTRKRSRS